MLMNTAPSPADAAVPEGVNPLSQALLDLNDGKAILVTGSSRGGFVMMAAAAASPEAVNFMASEARGLVGLAITLRHSAELGLSLQPRRGDEDRPFYTQSIEAREDVSTGISAEDRCRTIRAAALGGRDAIVTPGHVFPQIPEGVAYAHADLALALLAKAHEAPAAMICSVLDAAGHLADLTSLSSFAKAHGLTVVRAEEVLP